MWFRTGVSPEDLLREAVLMVIEERFGPPPSEMKPAVRALVERADRQQVLERVLTATSLAELLADEV